MTYEEAVAYLEGIGKFTADPSLAHTDRLLERLGHPEEGKKIIHVAGTNGKGSVCAYLRSMLMEGGYRVGFFTSPHLVRINERFQIGTTEVDDDTFLQAFLQVKRAIDDSVAEGETHPTYFETLFLMATVIFQKADVDYIILEVGLGGRLDATNVIRHPLACIITSISLDHTEYLGDTTAKIAGEKAGILKPGVPVVFDGHDRDAAAVIRRRAEELGCPAYELMPDNYQPVAQTQDGVIFDFQCPRIHEPETGFPEAPGGPQKFAGTVRLHIPQVAEYQMMNASLAFFTMLILEAEHHIPVEKLTAGIAGMQWPCRMETVLPGVVVDGAHNPDGIAQFVRTAAHFHEQYEITILFSAVSDKDHADMIREIVEGIHPERVVTSRIAGSRCISEQELAEEFRRAGQTNVFSDANIGKAFDLALSLKGDGMLFCIGSLYMAGQIKAWLEEKKQ